MTFHALNKTNVYSYTQFCSLLFCSSVILSIKNVVDELYFERIVNELLF